jgi:hypothetical protein
MASIELPQDESDFSEVDIDSEEKKLSKPEDLDRSESNSNGIEERPFEINQSQPRTMLGHAAAKLTSR